MRVVLAWQAHPDGSEARQMSLTAGSLCGPYEVVGLLGTGGMGEVYRARDAKLGAQVAIKVLSVAALPIPSRSGAFEQEARAASALNHPGIVTIHDGGRSDGQFYIVMELVDGTTLRQLLRAAPAPEEGPPDGQSTRRRAREGARRRHRPSRSQARKRDAHRRGHVKIVDFGLAKLTEPACDPDRSRRRRRTTGDGARHRRLHVAGTGERRERPIFARTSSRSAPSCTSWPPAARAFHRRRASRRCR